ncbi:acid protease [Pleomassaria siparia CBS 279.74]|uniref:Acid protease n=1 Tax=Pleomassaria siparia CBS 279.74 TaxID=1314801 RepID=A0A6G1KIZ1_9PLEO|nr:acid protease [Pleomassaria siparia CBS 279.74]
MDGSEKSLPMVNSTPRPYVVPPSQRFDGNDGSWSTFRISIGKPGQQFRVLASTKSGETYVVVPEGCIQGIDGPNCSNLRGADIFQSSQSPGFQVNMSSNWSTLGQYSVDLEDSLNYTAQGLFGFDKITLGSAVDDTSISMDHQVVSGIADTDYWMGYIPLGVPDSSFSSLSQSIDSFIYQLRNSSQIPSLSFSYTAGAKYRLNSVFGSLILGGYDSTRFKSNTNSFSFSFAADPSRLLTVGVDSILALNSLQGTYSLSSGSHFSLIDSTVPHIWLPRPIRDNFEQAFGLTYDGRTDLYLVNDTMHEKLKLLNPSITIKLEAYLIVDYERANFTIAQAAFPNPLPAAKIVAIPPLSSASASSNKSSKASLSVGAIAGIAAGGCILLILVLIGPILVYRKRRGVSKRKYELANTQISEIGSGTNLRDAPKSPGPQELDGTPLTELASPVMSTTETRKRFCPQQVHHKN